MNVEKFLAIAASILIVFAITEIVITPPVAGYEVSIYSAFSSYFWFSLLGSIVCGILILLHQAFVGKRSKWWLVGLSVIIFANSIFLCLPEFRGYILYGRGDTLTHLGWMKDIIATGHTSQSNMYPITHILGTILIQVVGIPLEKIPSLFFVLFYGIYVLGMHLLARSTSNINGKVILITAFTSPLIYSYFHVSIQPSVLSLFFVPYFLYFYQKREYAGMHRQNTILLLLMAFSITFFHPITTIFVIVITSVLGLVHTLKSRFFTTHETTQWRNVGRNFSGITLILFIAFFTWYLSYSSIQRSFKAVYDWLVYQIGTSLIQGDLSLLGRVNLTPLQIAEIFLNKFGAVSLSLFISSVASIYIIVKSLKKYRIELVKLFYVSMFFATLLLGAIMLFGYYVVTDPIRVARFPLFTGAVVSGLVLYDIVGYPKKFAKTQQTGWETNRGLVSAIAIVIVVMVTLSMGSVYNSPRVVHLNEQVTKMEIHGIDWLGRSKNPEIFVVTNRPEQIPRFEDYSLGMDSSPIAKTKVDPESLPSHFGYGGNDSIAEVFNYQDRYLVIFQLDKVWPMFFPEDIGPAIHEYLEDDFAKLNRDPTISKLYCNGEFEVWKTSGQ